MNVPLPLVALFAFTALVVAQPLHDDFVNRLSIVGTNYIWTGDNIGATTQPDEPAIGESFFRQGSIWWTWTAPLTGEATLTTEGSAESTTLIGVYLGDTLSNLTEVAGSRSELAWPVSFAATANQTYQIAVATLYDTGAVHFALSQIPSPSNDAFANRIPINGVVSLISGTTAAATHEVSEPAHSTTDSGIGSVWYSWRAPLSGEATLQISGGSGIFIAAVYGGDSLMNLTRNSPEGSMSYGTFRVEGGTHYAIAVDTVGHSSLRGPFTMDLSMAGSPPNDAFAKRVPLRSPTNYFSGSIRNATLEPGEPAYLNNSIWWTWTAPANGLMTLSEIKVTGCNSYFAVFTGNALTNLAVITSNSGVSGAAIRVNAGVEYHIALGADNFCDGIIQALLTFVTPPPNDQFSNRIVIGGVRGENQGTTVAATGEYNEPEGGTPPLNTVWYSWTAPADVTAHLSISNSSSHVIEVYTNAQLSTLGKVAVINSGSTFRSFIVTAGTEYQIQVSSAGTTGPFTFSYSSTAPPLNDSFNNRLPLIPFICATGTLNLATVEPNDPVPNWWSGDVWWSWTPASNCVATIIVEGVAGAPSLDLFHGTHLTNLTYVAHGTPAGNSNTIRLEADAGVPYVIEVGAAYSTAPESLRIVITTEGPPPHDYFADRFPIASPTFAANHGARRETGEPLHAGNTGRTTVWHSWIASNSGPVTLTLSATNWKPVLVAYAGTELSTLTQVATNSYEISSTSSRATFDANAGEEFAIAITGDSGSFGYYSLSLSREAPPSIAWLNPTNIILTHGETVTVEAQAQDSDGSIARVDLFEDGILIASDASATGRLTRSNVVFGIYTLVARATDNHGNETSSSRLTIRVPPANEQRSNRIAFASQVTGTAGASAGAIDRITWWSWIAPSNAFVTVTAAVGSVTASIAVYAVSNSTNLSFLGGSLNGQATIHAYAGVEYAMFVQAHQLMVTGQVFIAIIPAPENDQFANRFLLTGLTNVVTANIAAASREPGEPFHGAIANQKSLWWSWAAPSNGTIVIYTSFDSSEAGVVVYRGSSVSNLTAIAGSNFEGKFTAPSVAGQSYEIAVAGWSSTNNLVLRMEYVAPAANDMFQNRTMLVGGTDVIYADNTSATNQPGEPGSFGTWSGDSGRTLWWSWTAPRTGVALLETSAHFRHRIAVYTGSTLASLNTVSTIGSVGPLQTNLFLSFNATAGISYQIKFDGSHNDFGEFTLHLSQPEPPSNDNLANASPLTGYPSNIIGRTLNSTRESTDVVSPSYSRTIWWSWTAPEERSVTVVTTNNVHVTVFAGYPGPATLAVENWEQPATFLARPGIAYRVQLSDPAPRFTPISFSIVPNDRPTISFLAPRDGQSFRPGEIISFVMEAHDDGAIANVTFNTLPFIGVLTNEPFVLTTTVPTALGSYAVQARATDNLGAFQSAPGITLYVAQSNDSFARPSVLAGMADASAGNNRGATRQPGEPALGNSLWWEWTASTSGVVSITTEGSLLDTVLWVFTGSTISNLTLVASNDNANENNSHSEVRLNAIRGVIYRIAVAGRNGEEGEVRLEIRPAVPNDDFTNAIAMNSSTWTAAQSTAVASGESLEPFHSLAPGRRSLWWLWTAPQSGVFTASTGGSGFDTTLAIYTGNTVSNLDLVASDDDSGADRTSLVHFSATTGVSYLMAVDSFDGRVGNARLTVAPQGKPALFGFKTSESTLELEVFSAPGQPVQLQSSTNLVDWLTTETRTNATGLLLLRLERVRPAMFFRAAH